MWLLCSVSWGEHLRVIAHENFPKNTLKSKEIKALFLDKKHRLHGRRILAINYPFEHPARACFEKNILQKNRRFLERYWLQAHYHGKRPPKVVESEAMLLAYLHEVDTAIGYVLGSQRLQKDIKVLYESDCP